MVKNHTRTKIIGLLVLVILVAAAAVVCYNMNRPPQDPAGPGGADNLIDISQVQIYWNDKNVSDMRSTDSTILAQSTGVVGLSTLLTENMVDDNDVFVKPPQDVWTIASLDAPAGDGYIMGDMYVSVAQDSRVGLLWSLADSETTYAKDGLKIERADTAYARNGKEIVKLTFWGLDDSALAGVYSDGIILNALPSGKYMLYCDIEDNCGAVTHSGVGFEVP